MTDPLATRVAARLARRRPAPRLAARFRIEATARGVTRLAPGRGIQASSAAARRHAERARRELAEYLAGRRTSFSVPLDLGRLPAFQGRVLAATLRIGFGEVVSYSELAAQVGAPRAPRAVGTALARNPVPILVPCHRVVRRDGTWGPYAFGSALKTTLLALETRGSGWRA
ncbi:MAG: methylated-DNA--[protein]-cysteine S-methyltransferase [Candidatus Rokubacteria bacterium]|nr:methylated-DNA--[protein]-cysteine S-methyltransferase [Candidatus Rokubacteria bacterium]